MFFGPNKYVWYVEGVLTRAGFSSHLPPGREGESTVIGVNVFKFGQQLSGRFILPVVQLMGA